MCRLFLGVALLAPMPYGTHDVGLTPGLIDGISHGLAIDGQTLIKRTVVCIPALQGLHKDPLRGLASIAVVTLAGAPVATGIAHILPVGGAVDRADKARRIDKGLQ